MEAPAMAGVDRMAIEEVVRKVLVDEHAEVLRESVRWLAQQLMEVEVCGSGWSRRSPRRLSCRSSRSSISRTWPASSRASTARRARATRPG
jgi:hypothetical protein